MSEVGLPVRRGFTTPTMLKAIFTDVQFWVPTIVLLLGVVLLVVLH